MQSQPPVSQWDSSTQWHYRDASRHSNLSSSQLTDDYTDTQMERDCRELTTLWVARLDDGAELKVTDPEEQQGDVEEKKTEGEERWDGVDCWG